MTGAAAAGGASRRGPAASSASVLDGGRARGTGRSPGRDAGPGVPGRGRMGSRQPGAVPARRASAAGPDGVPGGRLRGHRAWHQGRRVVLAVLRPAHPGGHERRGDHLVAASCRRCRTARRVRGSRVPADVAGRTAGAADRPVPGAFAPVPPGRRDDDGTVPGRPAGAAAARAGPVQVAACARRAESEHGYCPTHYVRWRQRRHGRPRGRPAALAADRAGGLRGPGRSACADCRRWWSCEVLFGIQQRARGGAKITDVNLRAVCDALRRQQAASIEACEPGRVPGKPGQVAAGRAGPPRPPGAGRSRQRAGQGHLGPGGVRPPGRPVVHRDHPAVAARGRQGLGGRGAAPPPRRRRQQRPVARSMRLARLSESLRSRDDHGLDPGRARPGRHRELPHRLAYLESAGTISRYHRNVICRGARAVLAGIRALGLTRPGSPAAGLAGDFAARARRHPRRARTRRARPGPAAGDHGRAVRQPGRPASLGRRSRPPSRSPSTPGGAPRTSSACRWTAWPATPTARRCWSTTTPRPHRLGRRLPISEATAAVITAQQARVRARFPATPLGELKLLPAAAAQPRRRAGRSASPCWTTGTATGSPALPAAAHRATAPSSTRPGSCPTPTGTPTPSGTPTPGSRSTSCAELLDHRNLNVTRGYYRVGEDRRRDAVDKVTAMQLRPARQPDLARRRARCWIRARPLRGRRGRRPLRHAAPSRPTCRPAAAPARSGSAAPAATTSAPTSPTCPTCTAYLDDLLRTRERLAAAIDGVDEWARADATPAAGGDHPDPAAHRPDQRRHRRAHRRRARADRRGRHHRSASTAPSSLGMPSVRRHQPAPAREALA